MREAGGKREAASLREAPDDYSAGRDVQGSDEGVNGSDGGGEVPRDCRGRNGVGVDVEP